MAQTGLTGMTKTQNHIYVFVYLFICLVQFNGCSNNRNEVKNKDTK